MNVTSYSGSSESFLVSSYNQPIPAATFARSTESFRRFPGETTPASWYPPPTWSYFPHDPRQFQPPHRPSEYPVPCGNFSTPYPRDPPNIRDSVGGHFSRTRERDGYGNMDHSSHSTRPARDYDSHASSSRHVDQSRYERDREDHPSTEVYRRSSRDFSRSRSRSGSHSRSRSGSPPGRYAAAGYAGSPISGDSEQDVFEFDNASMSHRGNLVIPEVSRILQIPPPSPKEPSRTSFRRESTKPNPPPKFTIPVDGFCSEALEDVFTKVKKKQGLRIPTQETRLFQANTEDTNRFFKVPTISSEVKDKLRSENSSQKRIFPDNRTRDLNASLEKLDRHMRHGVKVTNFSILLSDVLARASEDPSIIDPDLLPVLFKFLDDCLGSCLREFATGSALSAALRRGLVLDNLFWPSHGSRERMEELPLMGSDLFGGKFDEVMLQEAKRLKTDERIDLRRLSSGKPQSKPPQTTGKDNRTNRDSFRRSYPTQSRQPKTTFNRAPTKPYYRYTAPSNKDVHSRSTRFNKSRGSRGSRKQ